MNFVGIILVSSIFFIVCLTSKTRYDERLSVKYLIFIAIIFGLRTSTPDTEEYAEFFNALNPSEYYNIAYYYEPGFQILSHLIKKIVGYNIFIYQFLIASLFNFLVYDSTKRFLKNGELINKRFSIIKCPILFSLILFYSYYGLFYGAIAIRAGIALAIGLEILSILSKGNKINKMIIVLITIILLLLALSFHTSSIIILLVIGIYKLNIKFKKKDYLLLLLIVIVVYTSRLNFILIEGISNFLLSIVKADDQSIFRFNQYLDIFGSLQTNISYKYVFQLISTFIFIAAKNRNVVYIKLLNVYYSGLILGCILSPIEMAYRVLDYFYLVTALLYTFSIVNLNSIRGVFFSYIAVIFQIILIIRIC